MILVQAQYCPQSHRCPTMRVCPTGALQQEGNKAPTIDQELCIECGKCTESCRVFKSVASGPESGNGQSAAKAEPAPVPGGLLGMLRRSK
jgi:Fe-S-cluster-containing hydrogenase component 2